MLKLKVQQKKKHLMPFSRLQQSGYLYVGHIILLKVKQCGHGSVRKGKEDSFLTFFSVRCALLLPLNFLVMMGLFDCIVCFCDLIVMLLG